VEITQLLGFLVEVLESQHLPYAIVGSQASMTYGEARFTNDIDVVVGLTPATLRQFATRSRTLTFTSVKTVPERRRSAAANSTSSTPSRA
jgi:hypothetical protein